MTFEEVYQQIRKMHYEILDILTEYRDEWCDDCKRFNTVIRETLNREPSEDGTLEVKVEDATKVGRVLISDDKHRGGLYYPDEDEPQGDLISRAEAIKAVNRAKDEGMINCPTYYLGIVPSADRPRGEWISKEELIDAINYTEFVYDGDKDGHKEHDLSELVRVIFKDIIDNLPSANMRGENK